MAQLVYTCCAAASGFRCMAFGVCSLSACKHRSQVDQGSKMISLYSGTPGSGKSLHIARRLYYRLKAGQTIYCNFQINTDSLKTRKGKEVRFHYVPNWDLNPEFLIEESKKYFKKHKKMKEDAILLVIDECQLIFNARDWMKSGRNEWLSFFTQHRKYGYEIVLVAQFDTMIDKQIRSLIEYEVVHRKLSNFGLKGKFLSILFGGHTFVAVKVWYPMNEKIDSEFFHANRRIFKLYNTYSTFSEKDGKAPSDTRERSSGVSEGA